MAQGRHKPATNTAAVLTFAGGAGIRQLNRLQCSYGGSGTLAGGNLKVESPSGTTIWEVDLATKQNYAFDFDGTNLLGTDGGAMIITLAAGGVDVQGILNAQLRN